MRHRSRIALIVSSLVALALAITGCSQPPQAAKPDSAGQSQPQPAATSVGPLKLAILVSTTTDSAIVGLSQLHGAQLAIEEQNAAGGVLGKPVEVLQEDTANSNTVAINALNKVLASKPNAIVGPVWGTQMLAMEPVIRTAGIPITTPSGTRKVSQTGNPWIFRFFPHDGISKAAQTKFAVEKLGAKKPAVIFSADEYGQSGRDIILQTLKSLNIEPVAVESAEVNDKDLTAQIINLQKKNPDAILSQLQPANLATFVKQSQQLGLKTPHVASNAITLPSSLKLVTADEVKDVYVETAIVPEISPQLKGFVDKFKAKYGQAPDSFATLTYDSTKMLFKAVEQAKSTDPKAIADALRQMKYEGLVTTYDVDSEGNAVHQSIIYQFQGDKTLKEIQKVTVPYQK